MGKFEKAVLLQLKYYPEMQLQDVVKLAYQSEYGCGHMVADPEQVFVSLENELQTARTENRPDTLLYELLADDMIRLNLCEAYNQGITVRTVGRMFLKSAEHSRGSEDGLKKKLDTLLEMAKCGILPWNHEEVGKYIAAYCKEGCPAVHHSEVYRALYRPHYRVIESSYRTYLSLLAALDQKLKNGPVVLSIDGKSASGKTSLADF